MPEFLKAAHQQQTQVKATQPFEEQFYLLSPLSSINTGVLLYTAIAACQAANTCCILQPFTAHYLVVMHPSVETPEKSSTSMLWRTRGAK